MKTKKGSGGFFGKILKKAKKKFIRENENIIMIARGKLLEPSSNDIGKIYLGCFILITETRIIFWTRTVKSSTVDSFDFADIKSVEINNSLLFGGFELIVNGKNENISEMVKTDVKRVVEEIKLGIRNNKKSLNNSFNE